MTWLRAPRALLLPILSLFLVSSIQIAYASEGSSSTVRVRLFDVETGLPTPNVTASFYLTTKQEIFDIRESDLITFEGVTKDDGLITSTLNISEIPSERIRLFIASVSSQPPGVWMIEKVAGDREYSLWEKTEHWTGPRWMGLEPGPFLHNVSTYVFPLPIYLGRTDGGSTIEVSLYLRRGRPVNLTLVNPFHGDDPWFLRAVPFFWWMDQEGFYYPTNCYTSGNFAPINNNTLVVAPVDEPLEGTAFVAKASEVRYWGYFGGFLSTLTFDFSIGVEEGDQIDLTSRALRLISKRRGDDLLPLLDSLKPYGFSVSSYYTELNKVEFWYEQAVSAFEEQRIPEGVVFSRKAEELYNVLMSTVQQIPTRAFPSSGWIILTLLFFSFSLSCLVTEKKVTGLVIFDALFLATFAMFASTQPYLKLFLSEPLTSFRRIDVGFLSAFMQIGLPAMILALFLGLSKRVRDVARQTFGVAMRNLRRRRMRTALTLTVILIVSASAMSLLSTGNYLPSMNVKLPLKPLVSDGLTIYKYDFATGLSRPLSLQSYEISWLSQQPWVNMSSMYGVKIVSVSNGTTVLSHYDQFYLAAVDASFLEKITNAREIFGSTWLKTNDDKCVLVGQTIAEAYQLAAGEKILIDGRPFTVKGIFNEADVGEGLSDMDGERLLFQVYDPATKTVNVPPTVYPPYSQIGPRAASFLIGSISDFSPSELAIYKVNLIVNQESATEIDKITENLLWASYERKADRVSTFSIYEIKGGTVVCRYLSLVTLTLVGSWQTQVAPLMICALIVFVTLHSSVYERRNEIKTLSALGVSPMRIRIMFLIEGLTLGVLGGVLGYVFGFGLIRFGNIALIEGIEENLSTGTPLFISMLIAVLVSIGGCLLPAKEAVLLAVPSKELLKKYAGIVNVYENYAVLDVPIRVSQRNLASFDRFVKDMLNRHPDTGTPHGMFTRRVRRKEMTDKMTYEIVVCYASERTAHYLVEISLLRETDPTRIRTLIFPLKGDTLEVVDRWTVDHEYLLPRLAPILRQDLLSYIEKK